MSLNVAGGGRGRTTHSVIVIVPTYARNQEQVCRRAGHSRPPLLVHFYCFSGLTGEKGGRGVVSFCSDVCSARCCC